MKRLGARADGRKRLLRDRQAPGDGSPSAHQPVACHPPNSGSGVVLSSQGSAGMMRNEASGFIFVRLERPDDPASSSQTTYASARLLASAFRAR